MPDPTSPPFEKLLWVTNHPKSLKGLWPRRKGVDYIQGPPKATAARSAEDLTASGLVGAYVNMTDEEYRQLPVIRSPKEL